MVTLAENNPELTGLRFWNYPTLSDKSIDVLANSCPGLQELNFSFRDVEHEVNKLSSSFPDLKHLFARGCDESDDETMVKFVKKFRSLEKLKLDFYNKVITDSGIERMVDAAKNLKYLDVGWAPKVTKDLIVRLRMKYPDLVLEIY